MPVSRHIKDFIDKQSKLRLFALALVPRLVWWLLVFFLTGDFHLYDSSQFVLLADNLIEHQVFSRSYSEPFFPDIARTPGYPLFIVFFKSWGCSLHAISFIQMLLGSALPVLVYRIARNLNFKGAWASFLLLCLSPSLMLFAALLISDGPFLLILVTIIWLLFRQKDRFNLVVLGVLCGLLAITRPIGQFLPILFVVYLISIKVPWSRVLLFFVASAMLPALWSLRNYHEFGTYRLSSMSANNLLMYNATAAMASAENRPFSEVQYDVAIAANESQNWENEDATETYLNYCRTEAFRIFKEHPTHVLKNTAKSLLFYHLKPPRSYFDKSLGLRYKYDPLLGYSELPNATFFDRLKNTSLVSLLLATIQVVINLLLLLFGVRGFFRLKRSNGPMAWLLIAMVCYFWFLSVFTMTDARFQLPSLLLLALLSARGFVKR